jgi:hypothetical protein
MEPWGGLWEALGHLSASLLALWGVQGALGVAWALRGRSWDRPGALPVDPGGFPGGPCPPGGARRPPKWRFEKKKGIREGPPWSRCTYFLCKNAFAQKRHQGPPGVRRETFGRPGPPGAAVSAQRGAQGPLGTATLAPQTSQNGVSTFSKRLFGALGGLDVRICEVRTHAAKKWKKRSHLKSGLDGSRRKPP